MARRKTDYEDVEPTPVEPTEEVLEAQIIFEGILEPGIAPEPPLTIEGEPRQVTTFTLPRAVLYALIDPAYAEADVERAVRYGLLGASGDLTAIGELVLGGTDVIALRHVTNRAARFAQNAALGPSKVERA